MPFERGGGERERERDNYMESKIEETKIGNNGILEVTKRKEIERKQTKWTKKSERNRKNILKRKKK